MLEQELSLGTRRLQSLLSNANHPFNAFASRNSDRIAECINLLGFGAVVSGGQSGTDSAAFNFASDYRIPRTGFATRDYINENGSIPEDFIKDMILPGARFCKISAEEYLEEEQLEIPVRSKVYAERTELNAQYSCSTLILNPGQLTGGNLFTLESAQKHISPERVMVIDLFADLESQHSKVQNWLRDCPAVFLNIAGPRQSHSEQFGIGIYSTSMKALKAVLTRHH